MTWNPSMTQQLDSDGRLKHLLTLEGLPRETLCRLLDRAGQIRDAALGRTQKRSSLSGTTICTLFFEPSTRTRSSFQIAAQRLGADVINFDASTSSSRKGETALDTLKNLEAMGVRGFIVRHPQDGAAEALAAEAGEGTTLVNAGDGRSAHPTQGLLDALTLKQAKGPDFSKLKVLIVGDVKHSRVARSDLHALRTLGTGEIRVCGPSELLPQDATLQGCEVGDDFNAMLDGVDALTLKQAKGPDFSKLKVLIVGDVKHSRVARSDLHALRTLGTGEIRVCGPSELLPQDATLQGCEVGDDFNAMLDGVDAVMMLRLQRERMEEGLIASLEDYHAQYGLTAERLRRAAPDAVVLHPGPINRGVEITDEVADGPQSLVLRQVSNGVAIRMAVLESLLA